MQETEAPRAERESEAPRAERESDAMIEARRNLEVCNACRYCESYCAVFPAMAARREFSQGDLTHLANLCHGCKGCYHACQYAPPHAFAEHVELLANHPDVVHVSGWGRPAGRTGSRSSDRRECGN